MINFFRKLRRKFLVQNRFTKYLIYAIGEIVLVVIGILIALRVNNFNQSRILRQSEIKILKELKIDFENNFLELEGIRYRLVKSAKRTANVLDLIENDLNIESQVNLLDSLGGVMGFLGGEGGIFNSANTAFKNIENSGIKIIENTKLRTSITEMFERYFKNIHFREGITRKFLMDEYHPFIVKHMSLSLDKLGNEHVTKVNLANQGDIQVFKNLLITKVSYDNFRIININNILYKLNELISDVELEIERLESY